LGSRGHPPPTTPFMKLSSRPPITKMSGDKPSNPEDFLRKFDRFLATRYAREHLMKEARRRRAAPPNGTQIFRPRMDLCDDPGSSSITASLELPGLKPHEISIQLQDEKLTVSGERASPQARTANSNNTGAAYPVQELKYGAFRRIIDLPQGVQANQLTASMSDGMLVLSWPRDPNRLPPILKRDPDTMGRIVG